ncbi:hypothetical protein [Variovorax paradoxus]|uniref:Uncharacterized protein n=1 Tax=Variovorax paradoxus (strain EPS) TaxID=595537 RepID=E6V808_VARPE|nr:hypothetical protein [Variovorax paradoxus]ADU37269.1 hypothetical protein Varpa_3082 [Variovorax paradoxus EPS]
MNHVPMQVQLGNGWACQIEVHCKQNGSCNGRAEVSCNGTRRCVLMALNIEGSDDVLENLMQRVRLYMAHAACPEDDGD